MPLVEPSSYQAPFFLRNGDLLTLWASKGRRLALPWETYFTTVRLGTPDGDFFDVDRLPARAGARSEAVAVLSHGLEGNSRRKYMRGMAEVFRCEGWDVLARNFRGCSGEENRTLGLYHSGETEDLHRTVLFALSEGYSRIALVGFSMGGNQTLKYLGENPARVPAAVVAGVGVSVPCDLEGSAALLDLPSRRLYMEYFMHTLKRKVRAKARRFPGRINTTPLSGMHTFQAFDDAYTAPLHGFASARDYWRRAAALPHLAGIRVPALLLNAADDPFLSAGCFPRELARESAWLTLEVPEHGGHVGFVSSDANRYWSEARGVAFVLDALKRAGAGRAHASKIPVRSRLA